MVLQGAGVGSISFAQAGDVTAHDRGADGEVMVSKMKIPDGSFVISVQQTSEAHKWFTRYYNYVVAADASQWATASLTGTSPVMGVTHTATGVSPQKRGDKGYEASGKQVSWTFMAAKLTEV